MLKNRIEPLLESKSNGKTGNEIYYRNIYAVMQCMDKNQKKKVEVKNMRYIIEDKKYHFKSAFDTETGAYVRTGVLDADGKDTGVDPFMASYPHLIDVGIMGHCIHGKIGLCAKAGIGCYQSGLLVE